MASKEHEVRTFAGHTVKADDTSGIIESYVSIFGIADDSWMNDIVEPGAFLKTISERGPIGSNRIRVLYQHAIREVIGLPLLLEEHAREKLPDDILKRFPTASGGLFARTQIIMDVQRGREAFALYKSGAMNEWSFGFDTIDSWIEEREKVTYRHLREIRLWEYSPVTWGANPATTTVSVKSDDENRLPSESAEPATPLTDERTRWVALRRVKIHELQLKLTKGKIYAGS